MVYVDLRPKWLWFIGFLLIVMAVLGGLSAIKEMTGLLNGVKAQYLHTYHEQMNVGAYLRECVKKATCARAYYEAWTAPLALQVVYLVNLVTGIVFMAFSKVWKPEVWYRRQIRVGAGRVQEWRLRAMRKPKGALTPGRVR